MPTKRKRKSRYTRTLKDFAPADHAKVVASLGRFIYGPDYFERDGRYLFTEKVFQKLKDNLESEAAAFSASLQSDGGSETGPVPEGKAVSESLALSRFGTVPSIGAESERLVKVLHKVQNPRMLIAISPKDERQYHVYVGDSANFVVGMPLNVVPHPLEPAFWKVVGGLPRYNGRW